ncbi:NCS1 family nucleobase:cation symporter-1 [Lentzea roselyniae]|uniref:NCS1 family nucleobase:cation symporter-1 n=1 Tax=Lentzea roselyniae TaxID=531940 RepID=A0ABP7BG83_9PSEU
MAVESSPPQVTPDGRVELSDVRPIEDSRFFNPELAPVPIKQRTWTTYNFFALWMGMATNIPSYLLAAGLVAIGMNWLQAFLTITLGNIIVLVPMLLNSHAGTKYGIPFPVFARAFYGIRGANLAALLRAFIACGWFGIQTWVGGQAIHIIVGKLAGTGWSAAPQVLGQPWTLWLSFLAFWALQMVIIWRGMEAVRVLENWAAPLVAVGLVALAAWVLTRAGGFGPIFSEPSKLGWGVDFWKVFAPSLMGMIAFWATLSLNMPDFTRFGGDQRKQAWGQILGLPTTMSFIALLSVITTSGTIVVYGEAIWDPVALTAKFDNPVAVIIGLVMVILATISTNLAANVVSPSYDFSNAVPKLISFRVGGLITGVLGIAIMPWRLISDPRVYIFAWLGFYGGVLAAVAGVLVAGYWVRSRTRLELADLYLERGRYWFSGGWNWRAVAATLVGSVLAVGGAYGGPFPADGLIPFLKPLYDYNWVVGFVAGLLVFLALKENTAKEKTR